jgi:hypothetical protein
MLVDFLVVVGITAAVGATAPRWPARWLDVEAWHLPFLPWEDAVFYRGIGVTWLARRMPEAGAMFGGESKSSLPGTDTASLRAYYVEVSRAEWVHVASSLSPLVLLLFTPWQVALGWLAFTVAVNALFLAILRNNRIRILAILERREARV